MAFLFGFCFVGTFGFTVPKGATLPAPTQETSTNLTPSLFEAADCQISGSTNESQIYDQTTLVSINRQIFDRLFAIGTYDNANFVTLSCRADASRYSLVGLQMGIDDNAARENVNLTIDVYQGGNLRQTYRNLRAGSTANVVLDLADPAVPTNPNNFAVEMTCHTQRANCYLQFLEARLYPIDSATSLPQIITPSASPSPQPNDSLEPLPQPETGSQEAEPEDEDESSSRNRVDPIDILRGANEARRWICRILGC
ncbi:MULTISPECIES: hypothetical protein [unclassified Leptolyngbya]|uniref:hypothetical protein n=1 Tax=unclassified Leptolyngbya TaxID=2650499 RepID=UPI0016875EBF|nr:MULTISPECIES: hypothetical protein [unclassified Leptolyngbya]MBD1910707.1 hypothetical protein [Leptolyngbya sp. FACHB-8]MBD2154304.1 hypothetical protein [Leptolyngbya sp. FACHB-16]